LRSSDDQNHRGKQGEVSSADKGRGLSKDGNQKGRRNGEENFEEYFFTGVMRKWVGKRVQSRSKNENGGTK